MDYNPSGLSLCSRFAFPPNMLHFCGPEKQNDLKAYVSQTVSDQGLVEIISKFETLYPYLQLIAIANRIKDPFDPKVIEAYWIGNSLLGNVTKNKLYHHLKDNLFPKIPHGGQKNLDTVINFGFPYHNYHVLNIFVRTGRIATVETLETMDSCRISWGKIIKIKSNNTFVIETQSLIQHGDKLMLGKVINKEVSTVGLIPELNDFVSIHWNTICSVLSSRQLKQLHKYTLYALSINHLEGG